MALNRKVNAPPGWGRNPAGSAKYPHAASIELTEGGALPPDRPPAGGTRALLQRAYQLSAEEPLFRDLYRVLYSVAQSSPFRTLVERNEPLIRGTLLRDMEKGTPAEAFSEQLDLLVGQYFKRDRGEFTGVLAAS